MLPSIKTGNWNATEAEKRPVNQQQQRESLDFSKDSLNSPEKKSPELEQQKRHLLERKQLTVEEEEESSSSYSEAVRLESLAFTIDFGDVAPVKPKKKETPKRFVERLANTSSHSKRTTSKSTDSKKKVKQIPQFVDLVHSFHVGRWH